ncbi:hypothetical protein [uncultured Paludibaculum sp.]|uniref:hypothetical protein n=1 Tax=uncultured Paludibaculum sp. TaxID=1765020 RepID=UPI002AAA97E1|nr:hypothetical protein [uncultured Paludibaculum sp.]
MATEAITKLQPNRTVSLKGFDRRGAAAAIHSASATGFTVSGVFRDFADVAVVDLFDADNVYEHYTMRHLPDFELADLSLQFDLRYQGLQPIESPKHPWVAWNSMQCVPVSRLDQTDLTGVSVNLFDQAMLQSGQLGVAHADVLLQQDPESTESGTVTVNYLNIPFRYQYEAAAQWDPYVNAMLAALKLKIEAQYASYTAIINAVIGMKNVAIALDAEQQGQIAGLIAQRDPLVSLDAQQQAQLATLWAERFPLLDEETSLLQQIADAQAAGQPTGDLEAQLASVRDAIYTNGTAINTLQAENTATVNQIYVINAQITDLQNKNYTVVNYAGPATTPLITDVLQPFQWRLWGNKTALGTAITVGPLLAALQTIAETQPDVVNSTSVLDGFLAYSALLTDIFGTSLDAYAETITAEMAAITAGIEDIDTGIEELGAEVTSATMAASRIRDQINQYQWQEEQPAVAIMAETVGPLLTLKAARWGTVEVAANGIDVTWLTGDKFAGIADASYIYIDGEQYEVATVTSPRTLVLAGAGTEGAVSGRYLAERGGIDGNLVEAQCHSTGNLSADTAIIRLQGGSSDCTWRITLPFTALGVDYLRKMWLTLAPPLTVGMLPATEFQADFSNWTVTDPQNVRGLKVAGPGSVRIGSRDDWAQFHGAGWTEWVTNVTPGSNFYFGGAARATGAAADYAQVTYSCQFPHDLYLGTDLSTDRGIVTTTVDGIAGRTVDTYLNTDASLATRRLIKAGVPAGEHTVVIRNSGAKNAASGGWNFVFDYLEAAVLSDVPDPAEVLTTVSPALDWDTDHTYKLPPARLIWNLDRLGLHGDINEYIGVFWWNQRRRVNGTTRTWTIQLTGMWDVDDRLTVTISGVPVSRSVQPEDGEDALSRAQAVAEGIASRINTAYVGVWAEALGTVITVRPRTAMFWFTCSASVSGSGSVSTTGNLDPGSEGIWEVDPSAPVPLNRAARDWHTDLFTQVAAKGWNLTLSYSMELLNPPEDPASGAVYAARYGNGIQVLTSTGFGTEATATITSVTPTSPAVVTADGHGYASGDSINVLDVVGMTGVNGTWPVTRLNADQFSLDGSTASGSFVPWTAAGGGAVPTAVRNLRTTHCTFSAPMLAYQQQVYRYTAGLMQSAGLTPWLQFGEFLWWFFSYGSKPITGATATTPVRVSCPGHGLSTGQRAIITGARGIDGANGTRSVSVIDADTFSLDGSVGKGVYQPGTGSVRGWGMAYYDAETVAAAQFVLGRPLAAFGTQDDDPTVNGGTDAAFLADRLKAHVDGIRSYVLAAYPGAKFEWLHALDVNGAACYHTLDFPYPQGGRLNAAVNIPVAWQSKAGSGLDRIKMEALSWGATYRNLDKAKQAVRWPYTAPQGWPKADVRYLIPIFNGGCPWKQELLFARQEGVSQVNLWAWDHLSLLHVRLPLPKAKGSARLT